MGIEDARREAHRVIRRLEDLDDSPFRASPPPGYLRGIDFYLRNELLAQVARVFFEYKSRCGRFPDLISPRLYSEKLNWLKFFSPLKVPESGNKLLTGAFIPREITHRVRCAPVIWQSIDARLPANSEIPPGDYYLKANHGSGFFKRVTFPICDARRTELEADARKWLSYSYGAGWAEWWYDAFEKQIFVEEAIARGNPSAAILFYTFSGEVVFISIDQKGDGADAPTRETWYDGAFRLYREQMQGSERVEDFEVDDRTQRETLELARAIGRQFDAVRVDLIVSDQKEIFLGEITYASKAGLPLSNRGLDEMLGEAWTLPFSPWRRPAGRVS